MLKINIGDCADGNMVSCQIESSGSIKEVVADFALSVMSVYHEYERVDPNGSKLFRTLVSEAFSDHGLWDIPLPKGRGESIACAIPHKKED